MTINNYQSGSWREFVSKPYNMAVGAIIGTMAVLGFSMNYSGCTSNPNLEDKAISSQLIPISQAEKDSLYTSYFEGQSSGVVSDVFANGNIFRANSVSDCGEVYTFGEGMFFYFDQENEPNMGYVFDRKRIDTLEHGECDN